MSRDYKSHNSKGARGKKSGSSLSGTAGLLLGLAIGLGVALAVYIHGRKPEVEHATHPKPTRSAHEEAEENPRAETGRKFDFYEMLPKFEVVVPEREKAEASDARPAAIQRPGAYVLQAGSYRNFSDADRVRAQLALQGIESKVQKIAVDNDTWHRVRIGPISDLAELNRTREKLRQADVPALVIRVGE